MRLAPSILSADFAKLGDQVAEVEAAGARQFHLDVMDGRYVQNLTFGPLVVEAVRRSTKLPLDVHLQIENADRWIDVFSDAGADMIALHPETLHHVHHALQEIRRKGKKAGIALHPSNPLAAVVEVLSEVDYVIVMSVHPGFAGQAFIPGSFGRLEQLRALVQARKLAVEIAIDGGMAVDNIRQAVKSGADVVVSGSAIFAGGDPAARVGQMLKAAGANGR
ncbi:MAG TPA: ribulose-phosphate 3-epimerase [Vicinamibacteria bacterium]|nr:ribulose-phosphate 3-epimerase [Vicinamibacteria bacterium]